jgi:hypothetical protein
MCEEGTLPNEAVFAQGKGLLPEGRNDGSEPTYSFTDLIA